MYAEACQLRQTNSDTSRHHEWRDQRQIKAGWDKTRIRNYGIAEAEKEIKRGKRDKTRKRGQNAEKG